MRYVLLAAALALASCYDANSPNLPPCPKNAQWPDPCADQPPPKPAPKPARDAGK